MYVCIHGTEILVSFLFQRNSLGCRRQQWILSLVVIPSHRVELTIVLC